MEGFFQFALENIKGDVGIIAIIVLFIFSGVLTKLTEKTILLNQKQSFVFLKILFGGLLLFLGFMFVMYLKQGNSNADAGIKTVVNENNESNISLSIKSQSRSVETNISKNNNSTIDISQ